MQCGTHRNALGGADDEYARSGRAGGTRVWVVVRCDAMC